MAEMAAARCCLRLATLPPYPPSANCVFRRKWRFSPDLRDLQNLRVSSSCATYAPQLHTIGPNNATSQRACSSSDSDYADSSIREIRQAFQSMSYGEIRPSAYDTAWVARVPAIDGSPQPQFPQTLQWILRNQMADGSWGQCSTVYDRLLNALACSITLTLWGVGKICVHKGLEFIRKHVAESEKDISEAADRWNPSLVTNLADEMKICFHGLYTTVNELSNEASNAQGRDVFGCLHRAWVNMIASFNKVVDWWEDKYMPTFGEYVENGIYTFGLEPMLLHSTFLLGDRLSDDIVEQFDLRSKSLIHFMCLTGRLTNDARSTQAGRRDRGEFPWAIRAYMKDNPGVSEDEVLNNINGIVQRALNQLNWEVARPSAIPHRSKVLIFNSARAFQLIYLHGEGFTHRAKETSEIIAKLIFQPVK